MLSYRTLFLILFIFYLFLLSEVVYTRKWWHCYSSWGWARWLFQGPRFQAWVFHVFPSISITLHILNDKKSRSQISQSFLMSINMFGFFLSQNRIFCFNDAQKASGRDARYSAKQTDFRFQANDSKSGIRAPWWASQSWSRRSWTRCLLNANAVSCSMNWSMLTNVN